jgi:hypothetical protein
VLLIGTAVDVPKPFLMKLKIPSDVIHVRCVLFGFQLSQEAWCTVSHAVILLNIDTLGL